MSDSVSLQYPWQTENPKVFQIGERSFPIVKRGRELAEQSSALSRWLTTYGALAINQLQATQDEAGKAEDQIAFLGRALGSVMEPDALIDLLAVVLGCEREYAEENFDLGVLAAAAEVIWQNQPGLHFLVDRFASGFFGRARRASAESSASASSTPSGPSTDGQTETSTMPSSETESRGRKKPSS